MSTTVTLTHHRHAAETTLTLIIIIQFLQRHNVLKYRGAANAQITAAATQRRSRSARDRHD